MRNTFLCPKCGSSQVIEVKGSSMNQQTLIPLNKWSFKNATLDRFICADCGYTEEWVQRTEKFKRWAKELLFKQKQNRDDFV